MQKSSMVTEITFTIEAKSLVKLDRFFGSQGMHLRIPLTHVEPIVPPKGDKLA